MPGNNNKSCNQLSHSECKKSAKCNMSYRFKNGTFTSSRKGKGRVLGARCVNNPDYRNNNKVNRNSNKRNTNKRNSNKRNSNKRNSNKRNNRVSCGSLSHSKCKQNPTCHLDVSRRGSDCKGRVLGIKCINKIQTRKGCAK
jgi:hypothetical protein